MVGPSAGSVALLLAIQLVSVADEIAIGKHAQAEVRKQTPVVSDPVVNAYVRRIGATLAQHARGQRYRYSFSLANYREINAFALPGGPVWVNRGAIAAAGNESQFVAIVAHEIAHVALRHSARQLSNMMVANLGLSLMDALLGNTAGATGAGIAARYVAGGTFLKFSRDDEREADREGTLIMARAGWDPKGMIDVMAAIRRQQRRDPGSVDVFFSNHPSPQERIARLQRALPGDATGRRDSREFQSIRARLRRLPPAVSMKPAH